MSWVQIPCEKEIHQTGDAGDVLLRDARGDFSRWAGQAQCVYLDPPFMTGEEFYLRMRVGEKGWETDFRVRTWCCESDDYIGV